MNRDRFRFGFGGGRRGSDKLYTGQRQIAELGIYHYNARFYSPKLGRFLSADTIVPGYANPQNLNRFSYVTNNPLRYTDPTGHIACNNTDTGGNCGDTTEDRKLDRLLNYMDRKVLGKGRNRGRQRKDIDSLEAMEMVVNGAANLYGNEWDGFLKATTFVFTGVYQRGAGTMWAAHRSGNRGFIYEGSGFHTDFQDVDGSQQVRHFWAGFATAADPLGDNPFGVTVAGLGNAYHDFAGDTYRQDLHPGKDGATIMDYKLTLTAVDIAMQVGNQINTPSDLVQVLHDRLTTGYTGGYIDPAHWSTPYE